MLSVTYYKRMSQYSWDCIARIASHTGKWADRTQVCRTLLNYVRFIVSDFPISIRIGKLIKTVAIMEPVSLITNNLRKLRKAKGLTQKQVAALIGHKSEDRISHWEKGQMVPHLKNLIKLSKVLDVSLTELIQTNDKR